VLKEYGFDDYAAERMVEIFQRHDDETLESAVEIGDDMDALIDQSHYSREQLASLFQQDSEEISR
jgi:hypothetical protein